MNKNTTTRRVMEAWQKPNGVILRLECGHQTWCAGMTFDKVRNDTHECGQGPCAKPIRHMGSYD